MTFDGMSYCRANAHILMDKEVQHTFSATVPSLPSLLSHRTQHTGCHATSSAVQVFGVKGT